MVSGRPDTYENVPPSKTALHLLERIAEMSTAQEGADNSVHHPSFERTLKEVAQWIADVGEGNPLVVALAASTVQKQAYRFVQQCANLKAGAVRQLHADGWTQADIATELGLSRQRVDQLVNR